MSFRAVLTSRLFFDVAGGDFAAGFAFGAAFLAAFLAACLAGFSAACSRSGRRRGTSGGKRTCHLGATKAPGLRAGDA